MHELSLAMAMVDQVLAVAAKEGATAVSRITLVVGDFSGVEPNALDFCFPVVARGTVAERAEIIIEKEPPVFNCRSCGLESDFGTESCPHCDQSDLVMIRGRGLRIKNIEIV